MGELERAKEKLKLYASRKDKKAAEKMLHSYKVYKGKHVHQLEMENNAIKEHRKLMEHREESYINFSNKLKGEIEEFDKIIGMIEGALKIKKETTEITPEPAKEVKTPEPVKPEQPEDNPPVV